MSEPRDLVPKVPPEPTLSERFAGLGYPLDDTEEDTFIRPETMLRRALMAIDPNYADRTEIDSDGDDEEEPFEPRRPPFQDSRALAGGDDEATPTPESLEESDDPNDETTRQRVGDLVAAADQRKEAPKKEEAPPAAAAPAGASPGLIPGIAAFRVAVLPIPEEGDVRLLFIPPGAAPPPGVAVALLVPPSEHDARLINEIYEETDAKL